MNKFAIEYLPFPHHHGRTTSYQTDDPIEAEDFLVQLLLGRARITAIRHNGELMTGRSFDRMLKVAAERLASELLREALSLDVVQVRDRFGFAA